jgi:hypothetical protein
VSGVRLKGRGFTLTEIILVLFLLICLLIFLRIRSEPDWRRLRAYEVKQKAQFRSIDCALELFKGDFGYYPQSGAMDDEGQYYCGAMKLCEAMMGRDLMGFHPKSKFKAGGLDDSGASLYNPNTLEVRKGPYLPEANGNPCRLKDLYKNIGPFDGNEYVLCDTYRVAKKISNGMYIGMPVLYYKADTSKTAHDVNDPNNRENIYDYRDNHALLALGVPGKPGQKHPLYEDPKIFYEMTRNTRVAGPSVPNRADTYILLSAGQDGLYGTKDDIANFDI